MGSAVAVGPVPQREFSYRYLVKSYGGALEKGYSLSWSTMNLSNTRNAIIVFVGVVVTVFISLTVARVGGAAAITGQARLGYPGGDD